MKKEMVERFVTLVTAAFGLVAALAWNSAIQETFKHFFGTQSGLVAMFTYAILVTIIAFFVTLWVSKLADKKK